MTPTYLTKIYGPNGQDQSHLIPLFSVENNSNTLKDQVEDFRACHPDDYHQVMQEECKDHCLEIAQANVKICSTTDLNNYSKIIDIQIPSDWHSGNISEHRSSKWMPSEMRSTTRIMASSKTAGNKQRRIAKAEADQKQHKYEDVNAENTSSHIEVLRVCSNCNTTKTPLWRSGPQGPKAIAELVTNRSINYQCYNKDLSDGHRMASVLFSVSLQCLWN